MDIAVWANDFSQPAIRLIGVAEVAGALGLVLPWALDIVPVLTPIAGYCLAAFMTGAAVVHARRGEYTPLAFVAIARTVALA